jgi:hypothetical protein
MKQVIYRQHVSPWSEKCVFCFQVNAVAVHDVTRCLSLGEPPETGVGKSELQPLRIFWQECNELQILWDGEGRNVALLCVDVLLI